MGYYDCCSVARVNFGVIITGRRAIMVCGQFVVMVNLVGWPVLNLPAPSRPGVGPVLGGPGVMARAGGPLAGPPSGGARRWLGRRM